MKMTFSLPILKAIAGKNVASGLEAGKDVVRDQEMLQGLSTGWASQQDIDDYVAEQLEANRRRSDG